MASSANNVIMYFDFDPAKVTFSPATTNRNGGKIVYVKYGPQNQPLQLQTPVVDAPFGVSAFRDKNTGELQSYSVDISWRDADKDPKIKALYDRIQGLDEALVNVSTERSAEWMGAKKTRELMTEFCQPLVKPPKDPKYAPTTKVKVALRNGEPKVLVYDERAQPVALDYIGKNSKVKFILELTSVWFVNKQLGMTLRAAQIQVVSKPARLEHFAFKSEDEGGAASGAGDVDDLDLDLDLEA